MATKNVILKIGAKGVKGTVRGLKNVSSGLANIGKNAAIVSAGFAALSTKLAGDFQKNLLEISTLLNKDVDKSLKTISQSLKSAASASGLALESLSKAQYDIISAGFNNASDSAIVLEQSMKLAVGGVTSAAHAADLLTSSINAYGGTSADAQKISDALFTTVKQGKTTIGELGGSIGLVLPFAKSFNLSIENVGAALASLTAGGISTAESVTALKGAIKALESPSQGARKAMAAAGVEVIRFDDGTVDLLKTIEQFEGVDPELLSKFIPDIRGQLAIKTLANNTEGLQKNIEAFADSAGATESAFQKMQKGVNTQLSRLKNNFGNILIGIGDAIVEKLMPSLNSINAEFERLNKMGFENLSSAIKDQMPEILNGLTKAARLAFQIIRNELKLLKLSMLDAFDPFKNFSEELKVIRKETDKAFAISGDAIKDIFINMYKSVTEAAQTAKDKQVLAGSEVVESEKEQAEAVSEGNKNIEEKIKFITLEESKRRENERAVEEIIKQLESANVSDIEINRFRTEQIENFERRIRAAKAESVGSLVGSLGKLNQAARGNAEISKRLAQVQALIDTYAGANKALAASAPPFNFISAAAVIASGLANVATIEAQKFATGGIVQGDPSKGDNVPVLATAGELILNQAQQDNLAGKIGNITVNISAPLVDETVVESILPAIENAKRMNLA